MCRFLLYVILAMMIPGLARFRSAKSTVNRMAAGGTNSGNMPESSVSKKAKIKTWVTM